LQKGGPFLDQELIKVSGSVKSHQVTKINQKGGPFLDQELIKVSALPIATI
jgi:hypothetical protein